MRILLVEDHILLQESLARVLDAQPDMTVIGGAMTVQEAVKLAFELNPDCILMDLTLRDGSGIDAAKAILAERPEIKIVFLTIHEEDEKVFAAIRLGAAGYLPKNVTTSQLIEYLRGVEQGKLAIREDYGERIIRKFATLPVGADQAGFDSLPLTTREQEVLRELKTGATNRQIAYRLSISEQTVKNHVSHILAKLNLHSRHELQRFTPNSTE